MNKKERDFIDTVWSHYCAHGRHDLPWRKTTDPYRILVSEMMLQQTQVERVIPKYRAFLKQFPAARRLAAAPLGEVLKVWQGLGYNRRAKFLWETAKVISGDLKGKWPKDEAGLMSLPGVGSYTASAIMAFAYNEPVVLIETNVRQVYLHHFFKRQQEVHDTDILKLVAITLQHDNPREWYWALMDYGAHLKRTCGNINTKSKHYTKQSKFQGSDRQIRGAIVRALTQHGGQTKRQLAELLIADLPQCEAGRVAKQLAQLQIEQLIVYASGKYLLA